MSEKESRRHAALAGMPLWIRSFYVLNALGEDINMELLESHRLADEPTLKEMHCSIVLKFLASNNRAYKQRIIESLEGQHLTEPMIKRCLETMIKENLLETMVVQERRSSKQSRRHTMYRLTPHGQAMLDAWSRQDW
jgi:DNA-binding MarR family transcriptional regulator